MNPVYWVAGTFCVYLLLRCEFQAKYWEGDVYVVSLAFSLTAIFLHNDGAGSKLCCLYSQKKVDDLYLLSPDR